MKDVIRAREVATMAARLGYALQEIDNGDFALIDRSTGEVLIEGALGEVETYLKGVRTNWKSASC